MTGSRRLLLVEGENDKHVIMHLCNHHGLVIDDREISPPKDPKTGRSVDGMEAVTGSLSTQLKQADLSVLGVVLDADQDPQRRLDQVAAALAKENHHLPSGLRPDGFDRFSDDWDASRSIRPLADAGQRSSRRIGGLLSRHDQGR